MAEKHYKIAFNFKPYPKQQEILDVLDGKTLAPDGSPYRFVLAILGRQSGKSWLARVSILDKAINQRKRCMWVSLTYNAARSHWKEILSLVERSKIPVKKISQSAREIDFYGGGSISLRTSKNPDAMRGGTLDYVVLDEAAFYPYGEYIWYSIIIPTVTASKGTVFIPTTPNGKNWLFDLYQLGIDPTNVYYKSFRWKSSESPYQDKTLLSALRKEYPKKRWLEEFEAEFLSDAGGVFVGIDRVATETILEKPEEGHVYVMAADIGNTLDDTCITIFDKYERRQVYGEAFNDMGSARVMARIISLLHVWSPETLIFERNGVGVSFLNLLKATINKVDGGLPIEDLEALYTPDELEQEFSGTNGEFDLSSADVRIGNVIVRSVHMNNDSKRQMVEELALAVEYGRVTLLDHKSPYGKKQLTQMGGFEAKRTPSGLITYGASGSGHDDTVAALYLAYHLLPRYRSEPRAREVDAASKKRRSPFRGGLGARKHRLRYRGA